MGSGLLLENGHFGNTGQRGMTFLSEIFLNPVALRKEQIRDDYSIHRFVYSLFPRDDTPRRILYADCGAVTGGRMVLVLSQEEPLIPDYIRSRSVIVSENFFRFSDFRFQISMNPVKKELSTGKRRAIKGQLELLNWFLAHSKQWGFEADSQSLEVFIRPVRRFPKDGAEAIFNHVDYSGRLHVTDKSLFMQSFLSGLGHGKAFGFGLLRLKPIVIPK